MTVNNTPPIQQADIFPLCAQSYQQPHRGDSGSAGPQAHDPGILQGFPLQVQRIEQRRTDNDRGTVLVIMKYRDIQTLPQNSLNLKTARCGDIFKIDAAKGRRNTGHRIDKSLGRCGINFDIEHIDIRKFLEQHALALHDRLAGQGTDIAQPQHSTAIRDHRHQIALGSITIGVFFVNRDGPHWLCDTWRVGKSQLILRHAGLGDDHPDFARNRQGVIRQCIFFTLFCH